MKDLILHLKQQLPENLRFLERMVSMESPSFDKPLVDKFVRFAGSRFQEIGGEVEYVATERFGDQMLARFSGKSSDRILLLGHSDTVWPAGEIEKRPFKIGDGRVFGPGVFDMKAGILLMWMAVGALIKIRGALERSITILLNSDEELGSTSSRALIESEALQCRAVLVLEPSLPGGV